MSHPRSAEIDAYWAKRFGCLPADFHRAGVQISTNDEADPSRIAVFDLSECTIVRTAADHAELLNNWAKSRPADAPRSAEAVAQAFPERQWRISPSEKLLYLAPAEFRPFHKPGVRQLREQDSLDLTEMHRGCSLEEQQAGEVNIEHPAIFGAYAEGRLVAAASLLEQGEQISDVGVLVHHEFRRQGYGRAVVSALCQWGLDNGRIVKYCRLCANKGSAQIADSLGFAEYARYQILTQNITPFT